MSEIYADVYFLINFSMDLVCLYVTSLILRKNTPAHRLCIGALFGAGYSVLTLFLKFNVLLSFAVTFISAFFICLLAFFDKRHPRSFIFPTFLFVGISFFMGGALTWVYSFFISFHSRGDDFSFVLLPLSFALGGVSIILSRICEKKSRVLKVEISVFTTGRECVFSALSDTGNLLCEPVGGLPVIILSKKASSEYIKSGDISPSGVMKYPEISNSIRLIPMKGAGYSGMLTGFIPEGGVLISGAVKRVCVAFSGTEDFNGCDALLPSVLLQ